MTAAGPNSRDQARLWLAAFVVSAMLNALILLALAFDVISKLEFVPRPPTEEASAQAPPPPENIAMIVPVVGAAAPAAAATPPPPPAPAQSFARTSVDQESDRPENPAFIGERNTRATSDAPAVADAPAMPSQKGKEAEDHEIETTVSRYQDGDLASDRISRPNTPPAPALPPAPVGEESPSPTSRSMPGEPSPPPPPKAAAPPLEKLMEGPVPVERPVKVEMPKEQPPELTKPDEDSSKTEETKELPKTSPQEKSPASQEQQGQGTRPPQRPRQAPSANDPGFRGFQEKTQLRGSISRQGRSALDVEDSVLGRYHASLSRAVEQAWQVNCIRNRDYITPGQIMVRFVVEPTGKVRSVSFVEEFGVGNIQKGFTSESIKQAAIPPFPAELKKQQEGKPLEVTYTFIF